MLGTSVPVVSKAIDVNRVFASGYTVSDDISTYYSRQMGIAFDIHQGHLIIRLSPKQDVLFASNYL